MCDSPDCRKKIYSHYSTIISQLIAVIFKNLNKNISVTNAHGREVKIKSQKMDNLTYFEFPGRDKFTVIMK